MKNTLEQSLPQGFTFYDHGTVTPDLVQESHFDENLFSECRAVGFKLFEDTDQWIIIFFDKSLDEDIYTEMANVLASQFANQLARKDNQSFLLSPPQKISISLLEKWIRAHPPTTARRYWHSLQGKLYPLWMLVITTQGGNV